MDIFINMGHSDSGDPWTILTSFILQSKLSDVQYTDPQNI
jgi:hypothetical protein